MNNVEHFSKVWFPHQIKMHSVALIGLKALMVHDLNRLLTPAISQSDHEFYMKWQQGWERLDSNSGSEEEISMQDRRNATACAACNRSTGIARQADSQARIITTANIRIRT